MSGESNSFENMDKEVADSIADDSIKLFRAGLFMITIYAALLSVALGSGDSGIGVHVKDSLYTRFGFVLWLGAMIFSVVTYWASRRYSCPENAGVFILFRNTQDLSDYSTGTLFSLLTSILLLLFGLFDGYIKHDTGISSQFGLKLDTIGLLIVMASAFVFVISGLIFLLRIIRSILTVIVQ